MCYIIVSSSWWIDSSISSLQVYLSSWCIGFKGNLVNRNLHHGRRINYKKVVMDDVSIVLQDKHHMVIDVLNIIWWSSHDRCSLIYHMVEHIISTHEKVYIDSYIDKDLNGQKKFDRIFSWGLGLDGVHARETIENSPVI